MRALVWFAFALCAAGCGRIGFDLAGAGDDGGNGTGDTIDALPITIVAIAIDDTFIVQNSAMTNQDSTNLSVGMTAAGNAAATLIRFNLTPIPSPVTVTSATLRLHQVTSMGTGTLSVAVTRVTAPWDPALVTYATRPLDLGVPEFTTFVPLAVQGGSTWDLTGLTQAWISEPSTNDGIIIEAPGAPVGSLVQFGSLDNTTPADRPELLVVYQ